jgi:hypothetical protein
MRAVLKKPKGGPSRLVFLLHAQIPKKRLALLRDARAATS